MNPHIAQIPESDKRTQCGCPKGTHTSTYDHKASAHRGEDLFFPSVPFDDPPSDEVLHAVRIGQEVE